MDIKEQKKAIRKQISTIKKTYTSEEKLSLSQRIMDTIESMPLFKNNNTILLYYSLPDEVQTEFFINKWCDKKRIILPVVDGENLLLKEYKSEYIEVGYQSIMEPTQGEIIAPEDIELAIIPGVAFDKSKNRLGRGKGFYDRLLPHINCKVIGIGYNFQLVENIPTEHFDKSLDMVITETDIW